MASSPPPAAAPLPSLPVPSDLADALRAVKPSVRGLSPYTLVAPTAVRKLNQNEVPWDLPADLKRLILDRAAALPWNRYPEFVPRRLVQAIAERHGWEERGILVGNGSNEVIQATLAVLLETGDTVVAPAPTFSLYRLMCGVMGARYHSVPLGPAFEYDVGALVTAVRRDQAKLVVLNSPNNPTGSALPEGAVARLLDETDALILCDEAYQEFGGPSAVEWLRTSGRVIVFRTLSKALGVAGLRLGYALAHPSLVAELAKAKLPYNVNAISLAAAEVVLEHRGPLAERVRGLVALRDRFQEALRRFAGVTVYPSTANFVLVRFQGLPAGEVFQRLLDGAGILVRDVSAAPGLEGCLRISIGTEEDMDAVIAALRGILR